MEAMIEKSGPSNKRKADDKDAPAATQPPRKKGKKGAKYAASANDLLSAMQDEEKLLRADSYSPGFEKRDSPVPPQVKMGKRRGRSRTPWSATAAIPIFMDLDALQQSNQEQASIDEAATPAYSIAVAKEQGSRAVDVAKNQCDTDLPSLDKENVVAGKPRRGTKTATSNGPKVTKNLDSPKQGTKRSAEADSDEDEAGLLSQPPAKKHQRLKLRCGGTATAPLQKLTTEKANDEDAAEAKRKNPTSKKNRTKGKGRASSVESNIRSDGIPKLAWRVTSSLTPPPQLGRPLAARQLENARNIEERNPIQQQPIVQDYMDEKGINPADYWESRLMRYVFAQDNDEPTDPDIHSSASDDATLPDDSASSSDPFDPPIRPIQSPHAQTQRTRDILSAPVVEYGNRPFRIPDPSEYGEAIVIPFTRYEDGSRVAFTPLPPRHSANNLISADAFAAVMDSRRDKLDMGMLMEHEKEWERRDKEEREMKRKEEEREREKREMEEGTYKSGENRVRKGLKKFGE